MKFRKVRGEECWKAPNGTTISYNSFMKKYQINRRTFFEFANSFEEAKQIAETNYRFNGGN